MKKLLLALAVSFLAACAQMGMQTPDTFAKRVAAAYVTVQTVADASTVAVQSGRLSKGDATNVVTTSRSALQGIDLAVSMHDASPQAGEDKLAATLTVLTALQSYLATKGAK